LRPVTASIRTATRVCFILLDRKVVPLVPAEAGTHGDNSKV
jgi:hypothetical protein